MNPRAPYKVRFADGGVLDLGPRTCVMGILNVTPDSFSDGGRFPSPAEALEAARRMVSEGADLLDVGGESTRPGAGEVDEAEECRRVLPVIEAIKRALPIRVSVDTRRARIAARAIDAGADLINDVSGLRDPDMLPLLVRRQVPVVLMHMRGTPRTMQRLTSYDDLVADVAGCLEDSAESAAAAGLASDKILIDPGIGFAKTAAGSLTLLRELPKLAALGRPILIGASRKSFIGTLLDLPVDERLEGSLAVAAYASAQGVHVVRAHDVAATVRTVRMIDAIRSVPASAV